MYKAYTVKLKNIYDMVALNGIENWEYLYLDGNKETAKMNLKPVTNLVAC